MRRRRWWVILGLIVLGVAGLLFAAKGWVSGEPPLPIGAQANRVVVIKHEHSMELWSDGQLLKTYRVALGRGGPGPKLRAGDNKVPEGIYRIVGRNMQSEFYRSLHVGYPTPAEVLKARAAGIDPGGNIMIHGLKNGLGWMGRLQRWVDWTKGCIAVTDPEMDEVWGAVPDGTIVEIRP